VLSTIVVRSQPVQDDGLSLAAAQTAPSTVSTTAQPTTRPAAQQCPICGSWKAYAAMARHRRNCVTGSCNGSHFYSISQWNYHLTICELDHPGQRAGASTPLHVCKECKEAFNFTNFKAHVRQRHQGQSPDFKRTWTTKVRNVRLAKERAKSSPNNGQTGAEQKVQIMTGRLF